MRILNTKTLIPRLAEALFKFEGAPITLYPYQNNFLLDDSVFRIVMKARQLGFSWIVALDALVKALKQPYVTNLVVSSGEEAAKRVLQYVYAFIHGMPIRPKFLTHSLTECRFSNQSRIVSLPNNDRTVRGYRAHNIYCDEFASLLNDNDILSAIQPSISRGGTMTIISTPRGRANRFWDIWDDPDLGYSKHRVPWWECPDKEYKKMVKRIERTMLDLDFKQEYCCLTPNTIIHTDLGYKPIIDIYIGDRVLTHTGEFNKVLKLFKREINEEIFTIITYMNSAFPINITGNHKFFCNNKEWKSADKLTINDEIIYSFNNEVRECPKIIIKNYINKSINGFRSKWFNLMPKTIEIDKEIAYFFGWYVAEGCFTANNRSVLFTLSYKEMDYAFEIKQILKEKFNLNATIFRRGSVINIQCNSIILVNILRQFGKKSNEKKIPKWLKTANLDIQHSFFKGYLLGDGYSTIKSLSVCTVSKQLALDIRDLLLRLGYCPRIKINLLRKDTFIAGRRIKTRPIYDITASFSGSRKSELYNGYIKLKIRSITKTIYHGSVYNLEVEKDNSYALSYSTVHNCDPSISDMAFFTRELLRDVINLDAHYVESLETRNKVVMGIDFGKRVSSTAITVAEATPNMVKLRFQEELRNMPYDFEVGAKSSQLRRIASLNDTLNVDEINIDATGVGVRLEEDMRRIFGAKVESIIFTSKTKEILISNFKILCEKHGIELVNDTEFISQLLSLEKDITPGGNIRYKHIKGKKDDRVWSAALAVKDMSTPQTTSGYILGDDLDTIQIHKHLDDMRNPFRPKVPSSIILIP